jgi:hypothetical protein
MHQLSFRSQWPQIEVEGLHGGSRRSARVYARTYRRDRAWDNLRNVWFLASDFLPEKIPSIRRKFVTSPSGTLLTAKKCRAAPACGPAASLALLSSQPDLATHKQGAAGAVIKVRRLPEFR